MTLHLFNLEPGDVADTSDDWYTPRWVFDALGLTFDLDVAAPVDPARRTCPAKSYLTPVDDGLTAPWHGLVWCNPPYSNVGPWAVRWADHGHGLILVPAVRSLWLGTILEASSSFVLLGGVRFGRPDGSSATLPALSILAATWQAHHVLAGVAKLDPYARGRWAVSAS